MLKASLLAAAAFSIFALAGAPRSHAQPETRQIVVDPVDLNKKKGPGTGGGGGQGTGGGGGLGTGGGNDKAPVVVVEPSGDDGADTGSGNGGKKIDVDTGSKVATGGPASDTSDPLDAIIAPPPADEASAAVKEETPGAEKAPAETAAAKVDSPDALIVLLKSKGYEVEVASREKDGDCVLVVHEKKDKVFGYALAVDGKHGKVVGKQKINLAEYGYGQDDQYSKPKQSDDGYNTDQGYDSDQSGDDNQSYENDNNDYDSNSDSGYGSGGSSNY